MIRAGVARRDMQSRPPFLHEGDDDLARLASRSRFQTEKRETMSNAVGEVCRFRWIEEMRNREPNDRDLATMLDLHSKSQVSNPEWSATLTLGLLQLCSSSAQNLKERLSCNGVAWIVSESVNLH